MRCRQETLNFAKSFKVYKVQSVYYFFGALGDSNSTIFIHTVTQWAVKQFHYQVGYTVTAKRSGAPPPRI